VYENKYIYLKEIFMGGNAIASCRRYSRDEYLRVSEVVLSKLQDRFSNSRCDIIKSYHHKESFGDCDILLEDVDLGDIQTPLYELFGSDITILKNSNIYSFNYGLNEKDFQIDIIVTPSDNYITSLNYFAFNDCSNLLGRIFHKFGLKYGHDGLSYVIKQDTYVIDTILVSKDMEKILEFIGLDVDTYNKGFDTLEDIFNYVASSKYFHPDIYLLHNRGNAARVRDKKRKTYMEFLVWCQKNYGRLNKYHWYSYDERLDHKDYIRQAYLPMIFRAFPESDYSYAVACNAYEKKVLFTAKFNGTIVRELTGLEGKALGEFIQQFRARYGDLIESSSDLDVKKLIINLYKDGHD
jgi:hypothetical protein